MTSEIQTDRYSQIIRRVSAMIGPGGRVVEALTELFPVLDVERVPGELLLLGGTRLSFGGGSRTGDAGEAGRMQLFNPVDSNALVTVTRILASVSVTSTLRWGVVNVALTTGTGTETFRDTRLGLTDRPVGEIRAVSSVALADATNQVQVTANTPVVIEDPNGVAVLSPGFGIEVGPAALAITVFLAFSWRERPAEAAELQF